MRADLTALCPLGLMVRVTVAVCEGMRGGMTTGCDCECIIAADCTTLGSDCVLLKVGFSVLGTGRGACGFLATVRAPIFSDLLRGDGGRC